MADQPITLDDVRRLDARPGDTVVFRTDRDLCDLERDEITEDLTYALGGGIRCVVLSGGLRVEEVIPRAEAARGQ